MPDFETTIAEAKRAVRKMLDAERRETKVDFWRDSARALSYLLNLPAEDLRAIRFHVGWIVGEQKATYWHPIPPHDPEQFAREIGYIAATDGLAEEYWVSELDNPAIPGPLGVQYRERVINHSTARYQRCIQRLYELGVWRSINLAPSRQIAIEIGGGYGALAHHVGRIVRGKATCVLVDLPETLFLQIVYLAVHNPDASFLIYDDDNFSVDELAQHVFVFIPNTRLAKLDPIREIAVAINTTSMDEMSEDQAEGYLAFLSDRLTGPFFSHNSDRHPYNQKLASLNALLTRYFDFDPPIEQVAPEFANPQMGYSGLRQLAGVPRRKPSPPSLIRRLFW